ncbi:MAG: class I SAM-dependent DNA methyltransferase [Alphaproteobacteria bacterium]|nr:class I SAM-dependent DNA methyltransferase [Alphaproteobacteria bacterium]
MDKQAASFIERWRPSGGGEHRTYQMFLTELCALLDVGLPDTAGDEYGFERRVPIRYWDGTVSAGRIDLYKRGCFVLEAKQGSFKPERELPDLPGLAGYAPKKGGGKGHGVRGTKQWDNAMVQARAQAKRYIDNLPASEPVPPFLIVVDVGYSFELFADFTGTGRHYIQFPDAAGFRFTLDKLADPAIRDRLRAVWTDPHSLDPSRRAAKATRLIADRLARLAQSLESDHSAKTVSDFLMRCLFTMFAEDVGILKANAFTDLLKTTRDRPAVARQMISALWADMNAGSAFSAAIQDAVPQFNGALFAGAQALAVTQAQIDLLIEAAQADWRDVEPAIFGTLLERALDHDERHRLGAHYTPRAYVERLVLPTIIEPLRAEWDDVKVAALAAPTKADAVQAVADFHRRLCSTTVLDPACGSGNFLYVTLDHLKHLEAEVVDFLATELDQRQDALDLSSHAVDPHQFLGLEKNERAVPIAEMVLWIGHLQRYARSRPQAAGWPKPVLRQYGNIRHADALLTWRDVLLVRDEAGKPVSRWDGITRKRDSATGKLVPDESARVPVERYVGAKAADWPAADYIVGNPPFIGGKDLRQELGDGYAEALWATYGKRVPNSADFVMYWWHKAAEKVRTGKAKRFGFITTNSLPQTFSRRVVEHHKSGRHPIGLIFAIPDHPWVKALNENEQDAVRDAAAVRIAMTVGVKGACDGKLLTVLSERPGKEDSAEIEFAESFGPINADLTIGADVTSAHTLRAAEGLASRGVALHGAGFIVTPDQARTLGLGRVAGLENHILDYRNGRDLTGRPRGVMVIDLFGLDEVTARQRFPEVYQWVLERVKPHRDAQDGRTADATQYAASWWLFGKTRPEIRRALSGLPRYIATVETAKHRVFQFLDAAIRPDNKLIAVASADPFHLGVLSSRVHVVWALAAGGRLGVGNDPVYVKSACFDTFPFPEASPAQQASIGALAEELDGLRKRQLALHPDLTLTGLYNVLEKLRKGEPLTEPDRVVNDKGLVSTLKRLHDDLDSAVAAAYGWTTDLADQDILTRLVALNRDRWADEVAGKVRWLRPDFQTSRAVAATGPAQTTLDVAAGTDTTARQPWPKTLPEQVQAVRAALAELDPAPSVEAIAARFKNAKRDRVAEILQAMALMG